MIANWWERRRLKNLAMAVLHSLRKKEEEDPVYPSQDIAKWKVRVTRMQNRFHISAPDLDNHTQGRFIESLDQFFDVFSNPRYLIYQKGRWFSVPKRFGGSREDADRFSRNLRTQGFGRHWVHYAHGREGADCLLEARKQSLLRHFEFRTETRVRWETSSKSDAGSPDI
jgi:hypothetical protein